MIIENVDIIQPGEIDKNLALYHISTDVMGIEEKVESLQWHEIKRWNIDGIHKEKLHQFHQIRLLHILPIVNVPT